MIWTRELVLEKAGFRLSDVGKAITRTRQALDADDPETEQPDHSIRLRAAEQIYDLAGVRKPKDSEALDAGRPVQVAIILTTTGTLLPGHGVALHLAGDQP